jgi:2'-5' RNA ligase
LLTVDNIRLFIAIELPETVKQELGKTQESIRQAPAISSATSALDSIKWVNMESIHLTLKFLGYVPTDRARLIEESVQRATVDCNSFSLKLDGLGVFPTWTRPRVLWVGVQDLSDNTLLALQQKVEEEAAKLGFAKEERAFNPHLTLARIRETATPQEKHLIGEVVKTAAAPGNKLFTTRFMVNEVSLMRSQLSPHGARYTRLAAFPLQK